MRFKRTKATIFLLAILAFVSCKKDSSDSNVSSDYYVKFKMNGNWVTWKTAVGELGPDLADATKTDFGVTANDDAQKNILDISVQVDGSNFNTGSYDSDNGNYWVVMSFLKDANTATMKYYDLSGSSSKYIVNVTSITSTELRGTFTGNYLYDDFDQESLPITEGEFFVKRIR
jgi:hypothetical protein